MAGRVRRVLRGSAVLGAVCAGESCVALHGVDAVALVRVQTSPDASPPAYDVAAVAVHDVASVVLVGLGDCLLSICSSGDACLIGESTSACGHVAPAFAAGGPFCGSGSTAALCALRRFVLILEVANGAELRRKALIDVGPDAHPFLDSVLWDDAAHGVLLATLTPGAVYVSRVADGRTVAAEVSAGDAADLRSAGLCVVSNQAVLVSPAGAGTLCVDAAFGSAHCAFSFFGDELHAGGSCVDALCVLPGDRPLVLVSLSSGALWVLEAGADGSSFRARPAGTCAPLAGMCAVSLGDQLGRSVVLGCAFTGEMAVLDASGALPVCENPQRAVFCLDSRPPAVSECAAAFENAHDSPPIGCADFARLHAPSASGVYSISAATPSADARTTLDGRADAPVAWSDSLKETRETPAAQRGVSAPSLDGTQGEQRHALFGCSGLGVQSGAALAYVENVATHNSYCTDALFRGCVGVHALREYSSDRSHGLLAALFPCATAVLRHGAGGLADVSQFLGVDTGRPTLALDTTHAGSCVLQVCPDAALLFRSSAGREVVGGDVVARLALSCVLVAAAVVRGEYAICVDASGALSAVVCCGLRPGGSGGLLHVPLGLSLPGAHTVSAVPAHGSGDYVAVGCAAGGASRVAVLHVLLRGAEMAVRRVASCSYPAALSDACLHWDGDDLLLAAGMRDGTLCVSECVLECSVGGTGDALKASVSFAANAREASFDSAGAAQFSHADGCYNALASGSPTAGSPLARSDSSARAAADASLAPGAGRAGRRLSLGAQFARSDGALSVPLGASPPRPGTFKYGSPGGLGTRGARRATDDADGSPGSPVPHPLDEHGGWRLRVKAAQRAAVGWRPVRIVRAAVRGPVVALAGPAVVVRRTPGGPLAVHVMLDRADYMAEWLGGAGARSFFAVRHEALLFFSSAMAAVPRYEAVCGPSRLYVRHVVALSDCVVQVGTPRGSSCGPSGVEVVRAGDVVWRTLFPAGDRVLAACRLAGPSGFVLGMEMGNANGVGQLCVFLYGLPAQPGGGPAAMSVGTPPGNAVSGSVRRRGAASGGPPALAPGASLCLPYGVQAVADVGAVDGARVLLAASGLDVHAVAYDAEAGTLAPVHVEAWRGAVRVLASCPARPGVFAAASDCAGVEVLRYVPASLGSDAPCYARVWASVSALRASRMAFIGDALLCADSSGRVSVVRPFGGDPAPESVPLPSGDVPLAVAPLGPRAAAVSSVCGALYEVSL